MLKRIKIKFQIFKTKGKPFFGDQQQRVTAAAIWLTAAATVTTHSNGDSGVKSWQFMSNDNNNITIAVDAADMSASMRAPHRFTPSFHASQFNPV